MDESSPGGAARDLLRELRDSAKGLVHSSPDDRQRILARRILLREKLVSLPFDDDLSGALREHLSHVGTRLELIEGLTTSERGISLEVLELRGDLSWMPMVLPDAPLDETMASMEAEFDSLTAAADQLAESDDRRVKDLLATRESDLVDVLETRFETHTNELIEDEATTIGDLWNAYLEARDIEMAGRDVREVRRDLRSRIRAAVESAEPVPAAVALGKCAAEFEDRALDLLAAQGELSTDQAAEFLELGRREIVWLRGILKDATDRVPAKEIDTKEDLRKWQKRLRRAYGRLSSEAQEVSLQARLEGIFGARFVAFFENLILWLIVGVLFLLLVDGFLPHPDPPIPSAVELVNEQFPWLEPPFEVTAEEYASYESWQTVHHSLAWVDFAICMVFLLEFFTKLSLARGRGRWFLRHFLVDLIPSIPLTFIALRAGRLARFLRLPRLIRYVRVARPLARFFRFFGFLQRGMDRMMRLHGGLLNRNIVLFEPAVIQAEESEVDLLRRRLRELRVLSRKTWWRHSAAVPPAIRSNRLATFLDRFPTKERLLALPAAVKEDGGGDRVTVLRAEELIERLTSLDPGTVEAEIGAGSAQRIATTLSRLDVPILRLIPGLRQMIQAAREGEALHRVAAAGKALGRWLGKLLAFAHWISDLSGVVTGPQFLDRLGGTLVQATARPAKRLLMFGFGFLLLKGFVHLLGFTALEGIADWLERTLGVTFLVLGFSCLVLMMLGMWFRRVAGEATDFYTRTAEAQYINLLKSAKLAYLEDDLQALWERSLRPEQLLRGEAVEDGAAVLRERFAAMRTTAGQQTWSDKVIRLYRDYLDGAIFHSSDTTTTSQLLGNLCLEDIRRDRLGTWRHDRKRLVRLDLHGRRSAVRGPYFWFHSVNHSIAQWTAKLILEYNRHALPRSERASFTEAEVATFESWLDRKLRGESVEPEGDMEVTAFVTTEFTALHFLTVDELRDERVRHRFGERTLKAMRRDRQAMMRTVFGTHPFHRHPRGDRTINPFNLYHEYLAGGRGILIPLYLFGAVFKGLRWVVRRVRDTLREILNPAAPDEDRRGNWASYDVAVRKISRMRRPLYMECVRFRCRFDPEYLGLTVFPERETGVEGRTFRDDLDRLGSRDDELDEFNEIREDRAAALMEFAEIVEAAGGPKAYVEDLRGAGGTTPWREAYRAVTIAWAIDYRTARTLTTLRGRTRELFDAIIEAKGKVDGTELRHRFIRLFIPSKGLRLAFEEFLGRLSRHPAARPHRGLPRAGSGAGRRGPSNAPAHGPAPGDVVRATGHPPHGPVAVGARHPELPAAGVDPWRVRGRWRGGKWVSRTSRWTRIRRRRKSHEYREMPRLPGRSRASPGRRDSRRLSLLRD
jgi:hypothetical protein